MADLQIRFRSTGGDVGPLPFSEDCTVLGLKEKLFAEWPKDGELAKEAPACPAELRLLCAGKFLDNPKTLRDYKREMGGTEPGSIVTMHMLVRPPPTKQPAAKKDQETAEKPPKAGLCGCSIC